MSQIPQVKIQDLFKRLFGGALVSFPNGLSGHCFVCCFAHTPEQIASMEEKSNADDFVWSWVNGDRIGCFNAQDSECPQKNQRVVTNSWFAIIVQWAMIESDGAGDWWNLSKGAPQVVPMGIFVLWRWDVEDISKDVKIVSDSE